MNYSTEEQARLMQASKDYLKDAEKAGSAPRQAMAELIELLRYHEWRYYVLDNPLLSDYEYDMLFKKLEALEAAHPQFLRSDSPTQRVANDLTEEFASVEHLEEMLSLENSYNAEDLLQFDARLHRLLELEASQPLPYCVEPKFDGGTIVLVYENDLLQRAATRGNGQQGEEITANARTMHSLPLQANFSQYGIQKVELRGESLIAKVRFEELNAKRLAEGKELFANPRNAATGALRMKDPKQMAERGLETFVYQLGYVEGQLPCKSHDEAIELLGQLGFKIPQSPQERKRCQNIEEVIRYCQDWEARREDYAYEVDGMVVKLDILALQQQLGNTSHHPRWAIAYKFAAKQASTKLLDVDFQVGRTGAITPVAKLEAVELAGVKISSVSLHNEDIVKGHELHIGDYVLVERAGDVIPQIVKVLKDLRPAHAQAVAFPSHCPACQTALERAAGEAAWRCPNSLDCPAQQLEGFIHFVSKDAMDIEGMGQSLVEKLHKEGMLKSLSHIYQLDYARIESWEGFGKRSVTKLREAIENSKKQALHRLLFALGIRFVGKRTAATLAASVEHIFELAERNQEQLMELDDIGEKVAGQVVSYFAKEKHIALLRELEALGLQIQSSEADKKSAGLIEGGLLSGKTMLFTGSLQSMTRPAAQALAKEAGAKILSAVSAKLDYLVVGEAPGSKLKKAEKLGVAVWTEEEFLKFLEQA